MAQTACIPEAYEMNCKYFGRVLLMNLSEFSPHFPKAVRHGSEADVKRIKSVLHKLGFRDDHIDIMRNPSYVEIVERIHSVAADDHSDYNMFVCVIMTHGGTSGSLCASDKAFDSEELWKPFSEKNCPSLAGKPKCFIIQACRGDVLDYGVKVKSPSKRTRTKKTVSEWMVDGGISGQRHQDEFVHDPRLTPTGIVRQFTDDYPPVNLNSFHDVPDMVIAYSTLPTFYSFLTVDGSPFIQTLCNMLEKFHATDHLLSILNYVNCHIATEVESKMKDAYLAEFDKTKQMSCFAFTFTKLLSFSGSCGQ